MPTGYKPLFEFSAGGQDVTARFADRCLSITIELTAGSGAQDSVVIVLDDRDYKISSPRIKQRLDVRLGYNGIGMAFMGSFEVNKIIYSLPPRIITIHGTAASNLNELKAQRIHNFSGKTVEQILAEVGRPLGFKIDVHPNIADEMIPTLDSNTSFGSLVGRLERQYDAVAKINDGRISLAPRSGGVSVSDIAQPTYVLRDYSFADLEVIDESAGEYAKVVADYRDADGNRTPAEAAISALSGIDSTATFKLPHVFPSKEEAQAKAKSVMAQLDRSGAKISATLAEGDPWVRDLQRIVVTGIRDGIDGSYTLDAVRHSYEKLGGLRTSFTGVGGVNGLAQEFDSIGQPGSSVSRGTFLDVGPGMVFGQVLPPAPLELGSPNTSIPRLVGQNPPSLTDSFR